MRRGVTIAVVGGERVRRRSTFLAIVAAVAAGCAPGIPSTPGTLTDRLATPASSGSPLTEVRACEYHAGDRVASLGPAGSDEPFASPPLPEPAFASDATNRRHIDVFEDLVGIIEDTYVDPNYGGGHWSAVEERVRGLVEQGLPDDEFWLAMKILVADLGDDHSHFLTPGEAAAFERAAGGSIDYVGIGLDLAPIHRARLATVVAVLPGSPADRAGIRAHDSITGFDGKSLFDEQGRTRPEFFDTHEGSSIALTIAHPGETPRDVTLMYTRITGKSSLDVCVIEPAHVAYVMLAALDDLTTTNHLREALRLLTRTEPLRGVILDNRMNPGGSETALESMLGLFTSGRIGAFWSRTERQPIDITAEDVGGSQKVPLVVLVGPDTASAGELMSGVLQAAGRATVIGETSGGNVEVLHGWTFSDGSQAFIAAATFQPEAAKYGPWEDTGIVPDVVAPGRWDLFSAATDPALPVALAALEAR